MSGFELKKYAEDPQYVKEGPSPSKTVFTQLDAGLEQDFHPCPEVCAGQALLERRVFKVLGTTPAIFFARLCTPRLCKVW